jgi:hypothetical protein
MKVEIPDNLKNEVPSSTWGKVLTSTPVIMTVVATLLAGLSSSEMTRAQYDRSMAAQLQAKAGDQWGYFQAKRLRGAMQRSTSDLLQTLETTGSQGGSLEPLRGFAGAQHVLQSPAGQPAWQALTSGQLPVPPPALSLPPGIEEALRALDRAGAEQKLPGLLHEIDSADIAAELQRVRDAAEKFEAETEPVNRAIEELERSLHANDAPRSLRQTLVGARLRYNAARYDAEARLNQTVASFYELLVRKNNYSAERHHQRSQRFFYGMLAAQAAVIISTFAIAAKKRNLLWTLAAGVGLVAIILAIYVYLYV